MLGLGLRKSESGTEMMIAKANYFRQYVTKQCDNQLNFISTKSASIRNVFKYFIETPKQATLVDKNRENNFGQDQAHVGKVKINVI